MTSDNIEKHEHIENTGPEIIAAGGSPGNGKDKAEIQVDGSHRRIRAGEWLVSDLKLEVKVDAALVLAEISSGGLMDLQDTAPIIVRNGMKFMSHPRDGASS